MAIGSQAAATDMEYVIPPYPVRQFSVEEYHRLGELGILTEDDNVELLEGWIVPKMIRNRRHQMVLSVIDRMLIPCLPPNWYTEVQTSLTAGVSEPEPDLAILRGKPTDYRTSHPGRGDVAIVIEVADSSLSRDRRKARIYSQGGIPFYWIANLVDDCIEVYSNPHSESAKYQDVSRVEMAASIDLIIDGKTLSSFPVVDLLPS